MRRALVAAGFVIALAPVFSLAEACPQISRTLQLDDSGTDVSALQQFFIAQGYLTIVPVNGYFDTTTQHAVQTYQAALGIVSSGAPSVSGWGVVGPSTRAALAACRVPAAKTVSPKKVVSVSTSATSASAPTPSASPDASTLLAQITALQSKIAALQNTQSSIQLPVISTPTVIVPTSSNIPAAFSAVSSPVRTLSIGMSGADVTALQQFLATQYSNFTSDLVTGYFGPTTQAALQQWQRDHSIVSCGSPNTTGYGAVGPKTRAAIAATGINSTNTSAPSAAIPTVNPVPAITNTITQTQLNPASASCTIDGASLPSGTTIHLFSSQTVTAPATCDSVTTPRTCTNGTLSGDASYRFASCIQQLPSFVAQISQSCMFNDSSIANGSSVVTYQSSTVPFGQTCQSQTRTCNSGALSGSYQSLSCVVTPATGCSFNGSPVQDGVRMLAYQTSSVPFGTQCVSQTRICANGALSGSYQNLSCSVAAASSCTLNGVTVANGASQTFYNDAGVAFGDSCTNYAQSRTCNNGALSGDTSYQYASCTAGQPNACTFNGSSVASGSSVTAYQSSSVAFGQTCVPQTRACSNGTLSGTYQSSACLIAAPASCTFNGQTIAHGAWVTAYQASSVAFGNQCVSETRTCSNGVLSGSLSAGSCSVAGAASCSFNGQTVAHGASVTGYQSSSVPFGQTCTSQTRSCSNGTLSGSYINAACSVGSASSCTFNGQTIANAAAVTAYQSSSVASGQQCVSQARTCSNGTLSGSYTNATCSVQSAPAGPATMTISADGTAIIIGQSVGIHATFTAGAGDTVTGASINEIPASGAEFNANITGTTVNTAVQNPLNFTFTPTQAGTYTFLPYVWTTQYPAWATTASSQWVRVTVSTPASCTFNGSSIASGSSVTAYQTSSVAIGQTCAQENRMCTNGTLSGSYTNATCSAQAPVAQSGIYSLVNLRGGDSPVISGTSIYNYDPSVIYDNGIYRAYWCAANSGHTGDNILYAEASSMAGPWHSHNGAGTFDDVFWGTGNYNDFDGLHTCDPSVMKVGGTYYMYYTGAHIPGALGPGAIGVASSPDGITWTRMNGGQAIVSPTYQNPNPPDAYGVGEESVTYVSGTYYMMYNDHTGAATYSNGAGEYLISATDPLFSQNVKILTASGFVPLTSSSATSYVMMNGNNVDFQYVDAWNIYVSISHRDGGVEHVVLLDPSFNQITDLSIPSTNWNDGAGLVSTADSRHAIMTNSGAVSLDILRAVGTGGVYSWNLGWRGVDLTRSSVSSASNQNLANALTALQSALLALEKLFH